MWIIKIMAGLALAAATLLLIGIALVLIPALLPESRPYFKKGFSYCKASLNGLLQRTSAA